METLAAIAPSAVVARASLRIQTTLSSIHAININSLWWLGQACQMLTVSVEPDTRIQPYRTMHYNYFGNSDQMMP